MNRSADLKKKERKKKGNKAGEERHRNKIIHPCIVRDKKKNKKWSFL